MAEVLFNEIQRPSKALILIFLTPIVLIFGYGIYQQIYLDQPFGNNPMSNLGLIIVSVLIVFLFSLVLLMRMETKIYVDRINTKLFPIFNRTIYFNEIKSATIIDYGFVGGWGLRLFTKYGTVYNIKGSKGLHINLKKDQQLLIGTQKEKELEEIIKNLNLKT